MKVVIFGLGSIGQRHAKILKRKKGCVLAAFRNQKGKKNSLGIQEMYSWKEVEQFRPDAALVTNPTSLHITTAIDCTWRGVPVFIEKPLGADVRQLPELLNVVAQKHISTYVAYVFRFHPVIEALREAASRHAVLHMKVLCSSYLPLWRPGKNHLESYSAHKKLSGQYRWNN